MTTLPLLPLLVAAAGLALYVLTTKPEAKEIGRICFAFGLLAFLLLTGPGLLAIDVR